MLSPSFTVRRNFAKASFWVLNLTLFICLSIVIFGPAETSNNLHEAGIIIAPIIVCLTGIVAQYMKLVSDADANKT